jgi:hypothetical protein
MRKKPASAGFFSCGDRGDRDADLQWMGANYVNARMPDQPLGLLRFENRQLLMRHRQVLPRKTSIAPHRVVALAIAGLLIPIPAFACGYHEGFRLTLLLGTAVTSTVLVSVLALLVWLVKRLFFRASSNFSVILTTALLLSLLLGLFATFALPAFNKIYADFGWNLPLQTLLVLGSSQLLWMPLLLMFALSRFTRGRADSDRTLQGRYLLWPL